MICNPVIFLLVSDCFFNLRPNFWSHCLNSPESKAEVRYINEYIDGLLSLTVHILKEVYISSCDQISCKAHMVGEKMHKVFRLTRFGHKKLKGERAISVRAI